MNIQQKEISPTKAALFEGSIETIKIIPGIAILIEPLRKYKETIEKNQIQKFLKFIDDKIKYLEKYAKIEWYSSEEGREFVEKLVATALNAEYTDKMVYFRNLFINASTNNIEQIEKLKFIETTAHLSKASLIILAAAKEIRTKSGVHFVRQIDSIANIDKIINITNFNKDLVLGCINELYSEGVFNSNHYPSGTVVYSDLTEKFVCFLSEPE